MNQDRTNRKLAAIFSTDVVGYSRMMEADEAWTIQNLEENKKLTSSLIEEYKGRVVDSPGDNLLAEFNSVINAVECAVKIQKQLNKKNSKLMEDHRMLFRIGVNLGDVIEEDGKIYGNGVNIAARLEGLAEPGGICISRTAYDQVKSKVEVDYDYLGEYQVKNINEPVRVYRILMGGESTEKYVPHGKSNKILNPVSIMSAVIILLVIALGTTIALLYHNPPETKQVVRFEYELPDGQQFSRFSSGSPFLTVSPDGSKFVYGTTKGLFLRSMDELGARFIAGTDGNSVQPFFSPDGKYIGFFSGTDQKLKKVAVSGGLPETICNANYDGGFSWSLDNRILQGKGPNIMWVSTNGGNWTPLIEQKDGLLGSPQMLPGGESLMYLNASTSPYKIMVQSLKSGESNVLLDADFALYVKTGHIVYGQDNSLYAVPFDIKTLAITGDPVFLVENVFNITYIWNYAISDTGTLVYVPLGLRTFVWVDRNGKEEPLGAEPNNYLQDFKISPDGSRVALSYAENGNNDIWIWEIGPKIWTKLTFDRSNEEYPIWTPDGKRIIFNSSREGRWDIYWKASDGSANEEKIASVSEVYPAPYSTDGHTIFFDAMGSNWDIGMLPVESGSKPKLLLKEKYAESTPKISPDGRWLAYSSNESGRHEIYVRPFPDVDSGRLRVSTTGGEYPVWSPDGKELYYQSSDAIMAVSVDTEPTFKLGIPRSLFQNKYWGKFDIHPNGRRFLMLKAWEMTDVKSTEKTSPKIVIIANWFKELKEKLASK